MPAPLRVTAVRRLVTIPTALLVSLLVLALSPVMVLISELGVLLRRRSSVVPRLVVFAASYAVIEIFVLIQVTWLWFRAGFGRRLGEPAHRERHYQVLREALGFLYAVAVPLFDVRLEIAEESGPESSGPGPLLVLCRHAGLGDSFLLVHVLLSMLDRRPAIVLKDTLQLDPVVDLLVGRLPHAFVDPHPDDGQREARLIRELASGLDDRSALVIFPEGGNFTRKRRLRAIASLRRRGHHGPALRAQQMRHVLPPRPAGVMAALNAATKVDAVFVAHTGLDHITSFDSALRSLPLHRPVKAGWWRVPAQRIPEDPTGRLNWLAGNWAAVDAWIGRNSASITAS